MQSIRSFRLAWLAPALLAGCSTAELINLLKVDAYKKVAPALGQRVVVIGYWSGTHEASGIYFNLRELDDAAPRCVALTKPISARHGSEVRLIGTIRRNDCGSGAICLTACQPFELDVEPALPPSAL